MKYWIIVFLILVSFSSYSQKQIVLLDVSTLKSIEYATVYDSLNKKGTHSDENGIFIFDCQNNFQISHVSYETRYIDCENLADTIYLNPASIILNTIEVGSQRSEIKKIGRKELVEAGVGNRKSQLHYAGIKEAALYVDNPLKKSCYIYDVFFSFNEVRFDGEKKNGRKRFIS
ncbi:hypothetical protein QWY31_01355 [Cytophagales bacterium LB-30]|uniref:Uncharacterized protein n=1 Tax=Shiella aurantiaca TaxID=3058365 RepID=A0ABT8F149_9BACT|nr:hypothetical protein [Shiella aurantiaca]MDN4164123.1 hypothetical protein [Shiella aurantiaca]